MADKTQTNRVHITSGAINELPHRGIGCAMQVHNSLGNGFQEVIYQRALAIEMTFQVLSFECEKEVPIFYRDEQIGMRRVDFFVDNRVIVERNLYGRGLLILSIRKILFIVFKTVRRPTMNDNPLPVLENYKIQPSDAATSRDNLKKRVPTRCVEMD